MLQPHDDDDNNWDDDKVEDNNKDDDSNKDNITPKIQEVIFYVPFFVEKWGTVGILREEDTEEQHHLLNAILLSMANVKDKSKRLSLALKRRQVFRSSEKVKPTRRKFRCPNCSTSTEPVFLENKECPHCEYKKGSNIAGN